MEISPSDKKKQLIFISAAFILLFLSYSINLWKIADQHSFTNFDRPDEGMIISRLDKSMYEGIFSYSGLTGGTHYYSLDLDVDKDGFNKNNALQYQLYLEGKPMPGTFVPYKSQPGGQAILYSALQEIIPFSNPVKLQVFRGITAALAALCFALFLGWAYRNFGAVSSIISFAFIFLSPALTLFAHNLWWVLWSYYVPFITMLLVLEKRQQNPEKWSECRILIFMFASVFIKCFFTGFEYITSTLVAGVCPVIYYCLAERRRLGDSIKLLLKTSACSIMAVLAGMLILIIQISFLDGSLIDGVNHIIHSYGKRASFTPEEATYSITEILAVYFKSGGVFQTYIGANITYYMIIVAAIIFCIAILALSRKLTSEERNKNVALVLITAISISGPLSWFIIFKEHAVVHMVLDYIVWYFPFLLFVFLSIGHGINLLLRPAKKQDLHI